MSLFWKLTWLVSTFGGGSELEVAASIGATLLGEVCPVQTYCPEEELTLLIPHYLKHPPQYFPPTPAYPLPKEMTSLEEAAPNPEGAAKIWNEEDFFASTVQGPMHRVKFMVKDLLQGISIPHIQNVVGPLKDADFKITANQIIELITSAIAPDSWEQRGGSGRLHYLPDEQAIVVANNPDVQEEVQQLLKALRRLREPKIRVDRVPDLSKAATFPHCPDTCSKRRSDTYRLANAQAADVAAAVDQYFTNRLGPYKGEWHGPVHIVFDPVSNTLMIDATEEFFDEAMKRVADLDVMPPQVMIQVLIAEVDVGSVWYPVAGEGVRSQLRDLHMRGRMSILSRPQIITLSDQPATVHVGQQFPSDVQSADVIAAASRQTESGITLTVIPKINADGRITLRVRQAVSSQDPSPVNLGNGQTGTAFNVQEFYTWGNVADGETIAMGGAILYSGSDRRSHKIKGTRARNVSTGHSCRTCRKTGVKKELIIVLTPNIVRSRSDTDRISAEEMRRTDWIERKAGGVGATGVPCVPQCIPCVPQWVPCVPQGVPYDQRP